MTERGIPFIRPGFFMTHVANPVMTRLGIVPTLTVRGRRTDSFRLSPILNQLAA